MGRKKKQKGKYLGRRRFGKGNVKNKRGAGNRGGRGQSGLKDHKKSWVVKYDKDHFGRSGMTAKKNKIKVINLYEIENMIRKGKLKKEGEKYSYQFKGKIIGTGQLSSPVSLKALKWSKKTEEKVKKLGGEISAIA